MNDEFNKWAAKWWQENGWYGGSGGEDQFAAAAYNKALLEVENMLKKRNKSLNGSWSKSDVQNLVEDISKMSV